jgi:glycosyltransferase involved in cell wall biosynthesis
LPVVIMEAMALGRPVVSTYVGGIPELVRAGQDGWLVPAGSIDALAAALEECLLAREPALRMMGERARLRAGERHSIEVEAAKLAELFRQLGGASPANSAAVQPRTGRASS